MSLANDSKILPVRNSGAADPTGMRNLLFRVSLAGAPASTALNLTLATGGKARWLEIQAIGADLEYAVTYHGETNPTLVYGQLVTIGTGHEAAGGRVLAGQRINFYLEKDAKTLTYIWGSATAGALFEGYLNSGREVF